MSIVTFYRGDPKNAPRPTMPAHLGANAIITCGGRLLLERRRDSNTWGLIGGGVKKSETTEVGMIREIYEELGVRISVKQLHKLRVYGDPGRIAAFRDGSIWRMVIVVYGLEFAQEPPMRISAESRELRFFSREEIGKITLAVTHQDIVEDWFLNNKSCCTKEDCETK